MAESHGFLARLLGHLRIDEVLEKFGELENYLSRALLPTEAGGTDNISAPGKVALEGAKTYRLAVREVPVRSTQLAASNPAWASGAAAERTFGPIPQANGGNLWFDFYKLEKLVALYVQGVAEPALLFHVKNSLQVGDFLPLATAARGSYRLSAGSIWINSRLLAAIAPPGYFSGLTIRRGTVTLSAPASMQGNRLTIATTTTTRVELELAQPAVSDADAASAYGQDARAAKLELPPNFAFHFGAGARALETIGTASWRTFGHEAEFVWRNSQATSFDKTLQRVFIPLSVSTPKFAATENLSPFHTLSGEAPISGGFWALPAAAIDVANPSPAQGTGALLIRLGAGLSSQWPGLKGGSLNLPHPYLLAAPGRIALTEPALESGAHEQEFSLWRDKKNPFGTTVKFRTASGANFTFQTVAAGAEVLATQGPAEVLADRPVTAKGEPVAIRAAQAGLTLWVTDESCQVVIRSLEIAFEKRALLKLAPKPLSFVLSNALFQTAPLNSWRLVADLAEDLVAAPSGRLTLGFALQEYLPTLPDPYAARVGQWREEMLKFATRDVGSTETGGLSQLVGTVSWAEESAEASKVKVAFRLGNSAADQEAASPNEINFLDNQNDPSAGVIAQSQRNPPPFYLAQVNLPPDYESSWNDNVSPSPDQFALLDVSTNADLLGVSFATFASRRFAMLATLQVQEMEVVSPGQNVRAFTAPQISWEPVLNLGTPRRPGDLPPNPNDPPLGPNYYPNDGGPTRLLNNSAEQVALAPIPLTNFMVENFAANDNFQALSLSTLPFGLRSLALLQKEYRYENKTRRGTGFGFNSPQWESGVSGARQLRIDGGEALREGESDMFMGCTVQVDNILNLQGGETHTSTLGVSVAEIFNNEFFLQPPQILRQRGVPLTRMDLSGYGASIFSDWINPKAAMAETSQAKFEVFTGRCAHEVVQVKSVLYPWGIKVVRTITLFRANSGYCYRYDSGWRAESDGLFDFTYYVYVPDEHDGGKLKPSARDAGYSIHPGVCGGLFHVQEIRETEEINHFTGQMTILAGQKTVDENGREILSDGSAVPYDLQPVFFNADVEIENPVSGFATKTAGGRERKLVASKRILGFVQLAPRGLPLTAGAFRRLVAEQGGTIGGPIDCVIDIGGSGQEMRLNRFDMNNSYQADGVAPAFAVAARGSVLLPKDGSWTLVQHAAGTGEVTPVPPDLNAPLIRVGKARTSFPIFLPKVKLGLGGVILPSAQKPLLRIANPSELLRQPGSETVNFGYLQTTETQKALFLTPAYREGLGQLLSITPPLFADAFRIVGSKAIFPNIGDAVSNFGDVISLVKNGNEFITNALQDAGQPVRELMQINGVVDGLKQEGYQLLKKIPAFELPTTEWELINVSGAFRIYLEYKKSDAPDDAGSLDFDVNSFSSEVADQWKSKMSNVAVVIDLGPIQRLMKIKGNWNSAKGTAAAYGGSPSPEIEFAPALHAVVEILEILEQLQTENYADAVGQGLKLAMSNKAGSWEYKFEASKEIPVLKFPMPPFDTDPNAALKLEAGLKLGAYFNSALKITDDPKDLLPSAGAYLGFYGRLSVMCVSLSIATVYAVGQVELDIAADSKSGATLQMKFGFGAQIVIGLPVIGNVSVLYMVGIEIYLASDGVTASAFLRYEGHAELAAGLVSITISIEAQGSVRRLEDEKKTVIEATVTFALDVHVFLVIDVDFSKSWSEQRQIA